MGKTGRMIGKAACRAILCAGLLLAAGCQELFHAKPDEPAPSNGTENQFTVTFDADGGTPETQTRAANSGDALGAENMPSQPAKSGYGFGGWYTERNGGGTQFTGTTTVTANITVYAWWTDVQYTVTFDADGGTPAIQTKTVAEGGIVGTPNMPDEPTMANYTFGGWYTERNGGGDEFYVDTVVIGDITLYAKWTVIQYTVTFDADGGTPAERTKTVNSGAYVGTPNMPAAPERSGYIFGGWYAAKDGGGSQFYVDTVVTGNITVYAKWTLDSNITYTVTFDADGGSPATQTKTVKNGGFVGSDMPGYPAKSGYVFGGWYTAKDGGGTQFSAETTVTGDITVYAKWTQQHTVTFDADGGSPATETRTALDGASVGVSNMPADPARDHHTFSGWYTAANGGGAQFTGATPVSADITVYAKWTVIQYTVTFNADGGSPATQARTVNIGSSVGSSMPSDPARDFYIFGGWYTAANGGGTQFTASTTVTGNLTVYAKWTVADLSLNDMLAWISSNATEGGVYTVPVTRNETIAPKSLSYIGKNVSVTLNGGAAERTVSLSSNGSLFTVESGVTLTLDNNVTLQGRSGNNAALVKVNSGGKLVMKTGSKISGNYASASSVYGGGVYVESSGTFTMSGGTISGNSSPSDGGGVCVYGGGSTFTMSGGTISGNSASYGGRVDVSGGSAFTKQSSGTIYGSNAEAALRNTAFSDSYGHAVYVDTSPSKKRNTTAGEGVTLDSSVSGSDGGWE